MNSFFSSCLQEQTVDTLDIIKPQPIKFKLLKSLSLLQFILKHFAEPNKSEKYNFDRNNLHFLETDNSHIPAIYFPATSPPLSLLMIYCHGSGSTLNHVRDFVYAMHLRFGIGTIGYDNTGEGQSEKEFINYQNDLKVVLSWGVKMGYELNRIILCGFSLGSYAALSLKGQMPRILISPICGIISFFENKAARYEGQKYDNVQQALKRKCKSLIFHCRKQMVDISHGILIAEALLRNAAAPSDVTFHQIVDQDYEHRSAPTYLCSSVGMSTINKFLVDVHNATRRENLKSNQTMQLLQQLNLMEFKVTKCENDLTGEIK